MKTCEHLNFGAKCDVHRITDGEDGPVFAFKADLSVSCADCGLAFVFEGLPLGLRNHEPTVSIDGRTAQLPMRPFNPDKPLLEGNTIRYEVPKPDASGVFDERDLEVPDFIREHRQAGLGPDGSTSGDAIADAMEEELMPLIRGGECPNCGSLDFGQARWPDRIELECEACKHEWTIERQEAGE